MTKKLDGNYTRMLRVILNKSWRQHPTKQQLQAITKTIKVRRTRHTGHCWRSKDELIRDVLLWTPSHGQAKAWRPARTYMQQLCADTWCIPEDLPEAIDDRDGLRERAWDIRADGATWWWGWWWSIICLDKVKCFQANIYKANNSIFTQLTDSYLIMIILLIINHLEVPVV